MTNATLWIYDANNIRALYSQKVHIMNRNQKFLKNVVKGGGRIADGSKNEVKMIP